MFETEGDHGSYWELVSFSESDNNSELGVENIDLRIEKNVENISENNHQIHKQVKRCDSAEKSLS